LTLNIYPVINKTLLKHFIGVDASGYYEKSDVMIRMALAIVTSISAVLLPHASRAFAEGKLDTVKKMLKDSFGLVSLISLPIAFGMAAVAPKFGLFFYGNGFEPVGPAMFIESFAIIFMGWSSITGNQYLIPTMQTKYYTFSVLIGSIINIVLDGPLIIFWGLNGAALATVLGEAFIAVYQLIMIRRQVSYSDWLMDIMKYLGSATVMFLVVFTLNKLLTMNIMNFIVQVLVGAVVYGVMLVFLNPSTLSQIKLVVRRVFQARK